MTARDKLETMDSIKHLLHEWASYNIDRRTGWPSTVCFATERVQDSNRSVDTIRELPEEIRLLDIEVERLAPRFKMIVRLEYFDKRPQKTKAAVLGIPRQVFSQRLLWIHEQLTFAMFGEVS